MTSFACEPEAVEAGRCVGPDFIAVILVDVMGCGGGGGGGGGGGTSRLGGGSEGFAFCGSKCNGGGVFGCFCASSFVKSIDSICRSPDDADLL